MGGITDGKIKIKTFIFNQRFKQDWKHYFCTTWTNWNFCLFDFDKGFIVALSVNWIWTQNQKTAKKEQKNNCKKAPCMKPSWDLQAVSRQDENQLFLLSSVWMAVTAPTTMCWPLSQHSAPISWWPANWWEALMVLNWSANQVTLNFFFHQAAGEKKKILPFLALILNRSSCWAGGTTETFEYVEPIFLDIVFDIWQTGFVCECTWIKKKDAIEHEFWIFISFFAPDEAWMIITMFVYWQQLCCLISCCLLRKAFCVPVWTLVLLS